MADCMRCGQYLACTSRWSATFRLLAPEGVIELVAFDAAARLLVAVAQPKIAD
jgi:hypothetical protein